MKIMKKDPYEADAAILMDELSETLKSITGNSGRHSFDPEDVCVPRSLFVIAYGDDGEAAGCGAVRPVNENTAEVKRMYARVKTKGVGSEILSYLETQAREMGYSILWAETRLINEQAVHFYENKGYHRIQNYGKYAGNPEAVCFEKKV